MKPLESRVAFTWTSHLSFEEILKLASELPPHSAIFWHTMYVDGAGVAHEGDSALKRLHAIANAPIFSLFDVFYTGETVGGLMHSMLEEAQETAAVAIRILNGEKPGDIKVPPTRFATPKFDWREMQRWGISEKNLSPGSEILFRPPTAWEQYKMPISAITAAILAQALLIAWLIYERQNRRRAERTARETFSELAQVNRMATAGELSATIAHDIGGIDFFAARAGKADHRVMVATTKAPGGRGSSWLARRGHNPPLASGETELQLLAHLVAILFLFSPCGNVGIISEHSTRVRRVSCKSRTTKRGGGTWGNAGCVHFALLLQSRHFWRLT